MPSNRENREYIKIIEGVFLLFGLHIFALIATSFLGFLLNALLSLVSLQIIGSWISLIGLFAIFGIGIFQLLYVIPAVILFNKNRQWGLMKGVVIGAVITALLNGGCYLLISTAVG